MTLPGPEGPPSLPPQGGGAAECARGREGGARGARGGTKGEGGRGYARPVPPPLARRSAAHATSERPPARRADARAPPCRRRGDRAPAAPGGASRRASRAARSGPRLPRCRRRQARARVRARDDAGRGARSPPSDVWWWVLRACGGGCARVRGGRAGCSRRGRFVMRDRAFVMRDLCALLGATGVHGPLFVSAQFGRAGGPPAVDSRAIAHGTPPSPNHAATAPSSAATASESE